MIGTIILGIFMFSLIVFVHEFGHFITARMFGVKVHEFAIGMGPAIFSKQKGDTKYSVRIIPMGGYCKMEGEDCESEDKGSFSAKPWYARGVILASGAIMNILLGFVICLIFVVYTANITGIPTTVVDKVVEGSEAAEFLQPGDRIIKVNGERINIKQDLDFIMDQNGNKDFTVTVDRNGEKLTKTISPYVDETEGGAKRYLIGITIRIEKPGIFNVLRESFFRTVWMTKLVFVSLGMLFGGKASVKDISGPVGVVGAMSTTVQSGGWIALLYLVGFLTVNIGIMNLLPIPALDGGRIFFVLIEAIIRKPIPPQKEGVVHAIGLILLVGVMIFATWNDIVRLLQ